MDDGYKLPILRKGNNHRAGMTTIDNNPSLWLQNGRNQGAIENPPIPWPGLPMAIPLRLM